jgi:hypothetical protein
MHFECPSLVMSRLEAFVLGVYFRSREESSKAGSTDQEVSRSNKSQAILAFERSLVVHEVSPGSSIDLFILTLSSRNYRSDRRCCCAVLHLSRAPAFGWSDDGVAWDSPGAVALPSVRSKQQGRERPSYRLPFTPVPLDTLPPPGRASDQTLSPCSIQAFDILSTRHLLLSTIGHQSFIPSTHPSTTTTTITLFSFPLSSSGPLSIRP